MEKFIGNKGFWACLFFFVCAGLIYGLFTARIPAIKLNSGINDAELGIVLLTYGIGSIVGFVSVPTILKYIQSRIILMLSALILFVSLVLLSIAHSLYELYSVAIVFGISTAFFDVCMNVQAMLLENASHRSRMASMHACYSLGGFLGSIIGSLFAFFNIGALNNFLVTILVLTPLVVIAERHLFVDAAPLSQRKCGTKIPFFVIFCGVMAFGAFIAEGSAAEWGGLLLMDVKGADAGVAALCFGAFSAPMALARLTEDRLREKLGDFVLVLVGAMLSFTGLGIVLLSPWPFLCLFGYSLMGLGLSPVMPIAISRAGSHGSLAPGTASAIVSLFGYGGLLVVPPSLGWIAQHFGLETAMLLPLGLCGMLVAGSVKFRN